MGNRNDTKDHVTSTGFAHEPYLDLFNLKPLNGRGHVSSIKWPKKKRKERGRERKTKENVL